MSTFQELLAQAKSQIDETDPSESETLIAQGWVVLDVREVEEYDQGVIPESILIPQGKIEESIKERIPDHDQPIIAMCAGGVRSAFAAVALNELGYKNVVSMDGGFNLWKQQGRSWVSSQILKPEQRSRYERHISLPEIGEKGQQKLLDSRVVIIGAGGLGSPAALYLAAAGVGTIGVVDMDTVEESNLQRQILHSTETIGKNKVDSAEKTLSALNPDVNVITYNTLLNKDNAIEVIENYDVVVDGTDNLQTRYLINDASVKTGIPVVHGSIFQYEGQITVFDPKNGPTYRDVFPEPPENGTAPNCSEAGVLGVLPGIVGSIQALETIKLILEIGEGLSGRLIVFDALEMSFHEYKIDRDPNNQITWKNRNQVQLEENEETCQISSSQPPET
ncbi:MAG TPA: molybdopterin-synthase adenylyltransferase MoeB [Acidimicrobiales bacterium]|nr:molybdopterin-synthase adenylyltransferase MoeB [Acidimicrobiales bacterium]HJM38403.1 molybdopterin-synthase adenylyltransferase MoeB [Acidimicrobiales bacterium]